VEHWIHDLSCEKSKKEMLGDKLIPSKATDKILTSQAAVERYEETTENVTSKMVGAVMKPHSGILDRTKLYAQGVRADFGELTDITQLGFVTRMIQCTAVRARCRWVTWSNWC